MTTFQTEFVAAADGARLARYRWPVSQPRCQVVIAHGMAEHAGRYDDLAGFLNAHDCEVWALDHRGHGQSVADGARGHFADRDGWRRVVDDLSDLLAAARAAHPGVPVVLFGHSMGSFIARATILARPGLAEGVVLSATGARMAGIARWLARLARWDGRRHGPAAPSVLMRRLAFGTFNLRFVPARTPFDWLSRDSTEVDRYLADPDCGFDCSAQLWSDLLDAIVDMEWREGGGTVLPATLSFWLVAGSHDPASMGGRGCRQLAQRYLHQGLRDIVVTLYPKARHEIMNETNRDEFRQDLLKWLDRRFPAAGRNADT